ncbi:MAG: hypothetical protein GY794_22235 [bacterium]|nr:hypothetical protein [bacterium]
MSKTAVVAVIVAMFLSLVGQLHARSRYAVVVSNSTYAMKDWKEVVQTLKTKYDATVIQYDKVPGQSLAKLAAFKPDYVAFVTHPQDASRDFVVHTHQIMRMLDSDPYTDAIWGIITGYDASDALRIAQETKPLIITRGASGMGDGALNNFTSGFASSEGTQYAFSVKADGQVKKTQVKPDTVKALVDGFNNDKPQCFVTSGHATTHDWQVGYSFKGGQFRCDKGQLYGLTTTNKRYDINSPNPKIYMPIGNCLIGQITGSDCMTTALIHSAGVRQMIGYTAVTWYGFGGWGVRDLFFGRPGQLSFAEAAYFNNQALMHKLVTEHPKVVRANFPGYDHKMMNLAMAYMARRYNLIRKNKTSGKVEMDKDAMGLLWDRDTVAFYGDPAWRAEMPKPTKTPPWSQELKVTGDTFTFTVTCAADGTYPSRPIVQLLPKRLVDIKIVDGTNHKPVITDNFILVPLEGKFSKGDSVKIVFKGKDMPVPK